MGTTIVSSCSTKQELKDQLRAIVTQHSGVNLQIGDIRDSTDLYCAGMSSQGSVVLMIAVEGHFGIEFPDAMLSRDVFTSIDTIADAVETVQRDER